MKRYAFGIPAILCMSLVSAHTLASDDPIVQAQELRQAPMKLIGNNFGFMVGMLKGEIPWNAAEFSKRGKELSAMGQLDLSRGYVAGSYKGHTRASADIADNMDDFNGKMRDFESALRALSAVTDKPDALKAAVKDLGDSCKGCHKEYKNREYAG